MVEYRIGDIFAFAEDAEALVSTVNCVGVIGLGVALQFKRAFPANFKAYAAACKREEVRPGRMFVFETEQLTNPRYIINFRTKRHWRGKSRIEDIEAGLDDLAREVRSRDIRSVALPPLGSGLGGLDWSEVRLRIEATLAEIENLRAIVFEPGGGPVDDRGNRSTEVPNMTPLARRSCRLDRKLSSWPPRSVCDIARSPQAHVLPSEFGRTVTVEIREGLSRPVRRESEACIASHRGPLGIWLRRWRRCARQTAGGCPGFHWQGHEA